MIAIISTVYMSPAMAADGRPSDRASAGTQRCLRSAPGAAHRADGPPRAAQV
jgi:hypothetical protein